MNPVETVLLQNIKNQNALFIFPTDTAVSRWADHLLRLTGKNETIAMNQFIAWDRFKQNSVKSKVQSKKSIPSVLRKIFITRLINENALNIKDNKPPLFTSLIRENWANQSQPFAPWLTAILPQLSLWFKKVTGFNIQNINEEGIKLIAEKLTGDDKDMYIISHRYAQFLEEHGLFEPAWETPPFNDDGKECFIFFPESLSDFSEYKELLEESSHVKIIGLDIPPCETSQTAISEYTFFYSNSRREITEAALYIRALHEKQHIAWNSIAVCIADTNYYEPYVLREFTNRNIPFVKKISKPLTDYPAGRLFRAIINCVAEDFSFSSLVSLVTNKNLPWRNTEEINKLIEFGIENNCMYSWTEKDNIKINVWEDAFKEPLRPIDDNTKKFYRTLKRRLVSLIESDTFKELRNNYFAFREMFFDIEQFSEDTDLILSRCISVLTELVEIEENFPDVIAPDPFSFFTDCLDEETYLAQQSSDGVAILPYKTAAAVPFDCHVILGAGQNNISVINTKLDFLTQKKRKTLGLMDEDASLSFISMHKLTSVKNCAFFCSEQTFAGFTIPHPLICALPKPRDSYSLDPEYAGYFSIDHYTQEKNETFSALHEIQANGFSSWAKRRVQEKQDNTIFKTGEHTKKLIDSIFKKNGKYGVSASSLEPYFQCSLKWLFKRVFSLDNAENETGLMPYYISGDVFHAILNVFLSEIKNKKTKLLKPENKDDKLLLPSVYINLLQKSIESVFSCFPSFSENTERKTSAVTSRLLHAEKHIYFYKLENFLISFLNYFAGYEVYASEKNYTIEKDEYILKGTVDCILKRPDGGLVIIDFKTNKPPAREDCDATGDRGLSNFQLPMYITLSEENEKIKVHSSLFYNITDAELSVLTGEIEDPQTGKMIPTEDLTILPESEWYSRIFSEFNGKTEQFSSEISTGNFSVFETKPNNCYGCQYMRICRTSYIINSLNLKQT